MLIFLLIILIIVIIFIFNYQRQDKNEDNINNLNDDNIFCDYKEWYVNNLDKEKIVNFFNENKEYANITFLLDTTKENFNIYEKYVYELSIFHLNRLNKVYDPTKYFIEFWWKNSEINEQILSTKSEIIHKFHIDRDEKSDINDDLYLSPMISTITYLTDTKFPTIISNISSEGFSKDKNYKYKIFISKGLKNKHISFNGSYYHGVSNIYKKINFNETRTNFMINIWENHKPGNINIANFKGEEIYKKHQNYLKIDNVSLKIITMLLNNVLLKEILANFENDSNRNLVEYLDLDDNNDKYHNFNILIKN